MTYSFMGHNAVEIRKNLIHITEQLYDKATSAVQTNDRIGK